ncbi:anthranilate synthase family protein [Microbulbifer variabilis]|uniref:anthranilate synthase family protein n=1 Tax=Microbulbifer variabilis TaxID=266805 RepID=UPI0003651CFC|nr:anthranilate synthase family protein [Microbulbifer variabilis]
MTFDGAANASNVLQNVIDGHYDAYALVYRPERYKQPTLEVLTGTERILENLAELELIQEEQKNTCRWGTLVVTPYRQIEERGFTVIDDQVPFRALDVDQYRTIPLETGLSELPDVPVNLRDAHFIPDDASYENIVRAVIEQEIGTGEGANFVIKRTFTGELADYKDHVGLTIFRNLVKQEKGAYWLFFIRMGDLTLVGASPEMHIKLNSKSLSMTPISGTYRFPSLGPTQDGLLEFLNNGKEEDELSMVLDEELKMMTHICSSEVIAKGPYLIQMSQLAHVGYRIEGSTDLPLSEILKRSMFAPTVTGSPLENATRVIARYETSGRSYYSGFAAMIENNDCGTLLDSAILIRTAEILKSGDMRVGVGATLVRDSDPHSETKETAAKAAALQAAMGVSAMDSLAKKECIGQSLLNRNKRLSSFWLSGTSGMNDPTLEQDERLTVAILDNEDAFTSMMEYQLRAAGLKVKVVPHTLINSVTDSKLIIVGPGPGDPCNHNDPRVVASRRVMTEAWENNQPFVSICFGHQILCSLLGLPIKPLEQPNQGLQKQISIFGKTETVGFYNTFTAISDTDYIESPVGKVRIYRDPGSNQVHGLQGPNFCSMQFHPESVLTMDGFRILRDAVLSMRVECVLN